jgi:hypothetical protein
MQYPTAGTYAMSNETRPDRTNHVHAFTIIVIQLRRQLELSLRSIVAAWNSGLNE